MTTHEERKELYKRGFIEGYKCIKGDKTNIPTIPNLPTIPINFTAFQEGIKAGIKAAGKNIV